MAVPEIPTLLSYSNSFTVSYKVNEQVLWAMLESGEVSLQAMAEAWE